MHFRQCGNSGDPYIICSQVSVDLHLLASQNRKKSNYWWNNLQVRGPLVCNQHGSKSSEVHTKENELVLRPGHLTACKVGMFPLVEARQQAGYRGTMGIQGPDTGMNRGLGIKMPGSLFLY